nr:MAG TPA: hypothetical protein [Caudoviricetes sp.]
MEEQDYIELNTLLARLRVNCLKNLSNEKESTERERSLKLIRNIDNIRNNMPLKVEEGTIFAK